MVISNTTPLINFAEIGLLEVLEQFVSAYYNSAISGRGTQSQRSIISKCSECARNAFH
jgi:predicted nucleic acid-binding protein